MGEDKKYTIEEANHFFGIHFNNRIWTLIEKTDRTEAESEEMIHLAHASLLHWTRSAECEKVNLQRGNYMISMVYAFLGNGPEALYYAEKCAKLTIDYKDEMKDFDLAYAQLALARAQAANGNQEMAKEYRAAAKEAGLGIVGVKDKEIFDGDLKGGPWYGC